MGIYDRDYYRREGPSLLGSFAERGMICKWLIGINAVVFFLELLANNPREPGGNAFVNLFSLSTQDVLGGQVWQLLTYSFLHSPADFGHILWNMLFLWWFGSELEDLYGPREFLAFYLVAATCGGIFHVLATLLGWMPMNSMVLGASGAVTAVLTLCAFHFPRKIILLFFVLPVPIWLFVVFQVGKDFVSFLGPPSATAVDVHLAGFFVAFAYFKFEWRFSSFWPDLRAWRRRRNRPQLKVFRGEDEYAEPAAVAAPVLSSALDDEQLDAKVDAILEKISLSGKESLTDGERQTLLRASERIKRRRT